MAVWLVIQELVANAGFSAGGRRYSNKRRPRFVCPIRKRASKGAQLCGARLQQMDIAAIAEGTPKS
jgi:hypothetical protein